MFGTKHKLDETIVDSGNSAVLLSNPEYISWKRIDQFVMSWLLSAISEQMLGHVIHCQSSAEIWNVLKQLFSTKSKARALQLRLQLRTTKKGSSSIKDYVLKTEAVANSLTAAGHQISEDELILYILSGLGLEFESVVVNLISKDSVTLPEVQYILQTHEMRLESLNAATIVEISNSAANLVQRQTPSVSNFRGYQSGFRGHHY